jgi:hypothetical protein
LAEAGRGGGGTDRRKYEKGEELNITDSVYSHFSVIKTQRKQESKVLEVNKEESAEVRGYKQ